MKLESLALARERPDKLLMKTTTAMMMAAATVAALTSTVRPAIPSSNEAAASAIGTREHQQKWDIFIFISSSLAL